MASPNNFKEGLLEGSFDLVNDTVRVALLSDDTAYSFDPDNHSFVSDIIDGGTTAEEFNGSGNSRQTLTNVTVTQDDTDDEGVADADDVTFSALNNDTIQAIVIYKQVGGDDSTPGDDPVLAVYDENSGTSLADLPLPTNGGDVTLNFSSEGIINIE
jgi:hypothetical protein